MERMRVGDKIGSDHHPIEWMKGGTERRGRNKGEGERWREGYERKKEGRIL